MPDEAKPEGAPQPVERKDAGAGGQAKDPSIKWSKDSSFIARSGSIVFVGSCILGLLYLLWSGFDHEVRWTDLRAMQLFLMTASLGIIVAAMAVFRSSFVVGIGILVIGALIIPTKDMVRFALLVFRSEQTLEELFPDQSVGLEFQGRDDALASQILSQLENQLLDEQGNLLRNDEKSGDRRQLAKGVILNAIEIERATTLSERVRLKGTEGPLRAMYVSRFSEGEDSAYQEYTFRYGRRDDFLENMIYLRNLSLVLFDYDSVSEARLTDLGVCAVEILREVKDSTIARCSPLKSSLDTGVRAQQTDTESINPTLVRALVNIPSPLANEVFGVARDCIFPSSVLEMSLEDRETQEILVSTTATVVAFGVPEGHSGSYTIRVVPLEADDPFVVLLRKDGSSCSFIDSNDDSGRGRLDSSLTASLETGEYLIVAISGNRTQSEMLLNIEGVNFPAPSRSQEVGLYKEIVDYDRSIELSSGFGNPMMFSAATRECNRVARSLPLSPLSNARNSFGDSDFWFKFEGTGQSLRLTAERQVNSRPLPELADPIMFLWSFEQGECIPVAQNDDVDGVDAALSLQTEANSTYVVFVKDLRASGALMEFDAALELNEGASE